MQEQCDKFASFFPAMAMMEDTGRAGQLPLPLAMAYVPPQKWTIVYDNDAALEAGTLFPALHLPFEEGGTAK